MYTHMVCCARVLDAVLTSTLALMALLLLLYSASQQPTHHAASHPASDAAAFARASAVGGAGGRAPRYDLLQGLEEQDSKQWLHRQDRDGSAWGQWGSQGSVHTGPLPASSALQHPTQAVLLAMLMVLGLVLMGSQLLGQGL